MVYSLCISESETLAARVSTTVAWPRPSVFEEVAEFCEQLRARSEDLRPELNLQSSPPSKGQHSWLKRTTSFFRKTAS